MAGRLRRTVVAVTLVVLLLPMAAATSLADTGPAPTEVFKFSNSGFTAFADAGTCSDPVDDIVTCSSRNISLVSGKSREQGSGAIHATEVCYGTFTDVFNQETGETLSFTGESGCTMDLGEGSVIERDLSSATIAPATITLEAIVCDPECAPTGETREISVEGTFTATSAATRSSFRSVFDDGVCTFRERSRGTERNAMFAGTADGQPLEVSDPDGFAVIHRGTLSFSEKCAIEA